VACSSRGFELVVDACRFRGTALREIGCGRTEIGWGPSPIAATEGPRYGFLAATEGPRYGKLAVAGRRLDGPLPITATEAPRYGFLAATEGPRYGKLAPMGAIHRVSDCAKAEAGYQVSSSCSMAYIAAAARVEMPILS
jgi:hypothetical protein